MKFSILAIEIVFIILLVSPHSATAAWQYPGCEDVSGASFKIVPILTKSQHPQMHEPLKMAFYQDEKKNVNIFVVLRAGTIKYYDAATKKVTDVGKLSPPTGNEDGLTGIVLDPNYKENGWIYLYYCIDKVFRLSRFTVKDLKLDAGSEKVILDIPSQRKRWHTSGAMGFDDYGDLWIHVGDNQLTQTGPSNTADLRGKVLRIRLKEDATYEIPKGNLWEFAAEKFEKAGQTDIAKEYRDPSRVKREIYAMGMRNPYTMGLDPVRRWSAYGDCGPDYKGISEEHSIVTEPGFYGWPYFAGADYKQPAWPKKYTDKPFWGSQDPQKPTNKHPEVKGVGLLLPHIPALNYYRQSCAMSGPIARYFPHSKAPYKIPPHLDRIWFLHDFNKGWVDAAKVSEDGKKITKKERMWDKGSSGLMLDIKQGPEGALYMLGYTCKGWRRSDKCTGIWRMEYTGNCQAADFKMEKVGCTDKNSPGYDPAATHNDPKRCSDTPTGAKVNGIKGGVVVNNLEITIKAPGKHRVQIFDAGGKTVLDIKGQGEKRYPMQKSKNAGLFFLMIKTTQGDYTKRFVNY